MDVDKIKQVKDLLSVPKKIVITTHRSPDGDAMGSSLGLYHYLKLKGHEVTVITPDDYPDFLHWLPGNEHVVTHFSHPHAAEELLNEAEVVFCLDYNSTHRVGGLQKVLEEIDTFYITIDHHREPTHFENIGFIDINASSTSEMIYDFLTDLGDESMINKDISDCLYAGIVTDTGSFRFSSTSASTHKIAAKIMEKGSNVTEIQNMIYNNSSEDRLKLLGYALSEKMKVFPEYKAAIIDLSKIELENFNYKTGDTEGIVNYPLSIKGIEVAVLITEKAGEARLSFRSKGDFPVNEIAREHFNGGGHRNAAGGIAKLPIGDVLERLVKIIKGLKGSLY